MTGLNQQKVKWEVRLRTILYKLGLIRATATKYVSSAPTAQNAVNILQGEWRSKFPEPLAHIQAGNAPLFQDGRITWLIEELGGITGMTVLELGPLEGGHSYMLAQAGAVHITAIEANTQAYLKCLIVKELFALQTVNFLCGDFVEYLKQPVGPAFDLCVASGVLYHMQNPVELIGLLAKRCKKHLFLWTHYYDEQAIRQNPYAAHKHAGRQEAEYADFKHTLYRYEYQEAKYMCGFSGAGTDFSHWLNRSDLFHCLEYFGFGNIRLSFDEPDGKNGPALALIATQQNTGNV